MVSRFVAAAVACAFAPLAAHADEPPPRFGEAKVKAAFVFSFARYIEWPPQCFVPPDTPFVIGVTSRSAIYEELQEIVRTRALHGRRITLREIQTAEDVRGAHLIFIERADEKLLLTELARMPGAGVVTVGESDRFNDAGGMLTLYTEGDRLRFRINAGAKQETIVKLSSQLLKLAAPPSKGS